MKRLFLLCLLLVLSLNQDFAQKLSTTEAQELSRTCGKRKSCIIHKVYGGRKACSGQFPWVVAILRTIPDYLKGSFGKFGIKNFSTPSSLMYGRPDFQLEYIIGVNNLDKTTENNRFYGKRVFINDRFPLRKCKDGGDIVLVELDRDVTPDIATPICMPENEQMTYNGVFSAAGWGLTPELAPGSSRYLRFIDLTIKKGFKKRLNPNKSYMKRLGIPNDVIVMDEPIYKNVCGGDSGGALMLVSHRGNGRATLAGITSYGTPCNKMLQGGFVYGNMTKGWGGIFTDTRQYLREVCKLANVGNCTHTLDDYHFYTFL